MTFVVSLARARIFSTAAIIPVKVPPLSPSTTGYTADHHVAGVNHVCLLKVHDGVAVGVGRRHVDDVDVIAVEMQRDVLAECDDGERRRSAAPAVFMMWPDMVRTFSTLSRLRTLSWATITAPAAAIAGSPPVWSGCQCVLMTKRTGFLDSAATAVFSLAVMGAISSSTTNTPSSPTETATFPPANPFTPSIIERPRRDPGGLEGDLGWVAKLGTGGGAKQRNGEQRKGEERGKRTCLRLHGGGLQLA